MKVLGISGSPRKNGNTEILVEHALKPFQDAGWEIQRFFMSEKTINPCVACEFCHETGLCAVAGDDRDSLLEAYIRCDAVIMGSPVYYRNVTAQLKALFDRSYSFGRYKPLEGKPTGAIAVGRGEGAGQGLVLSIIYNYFLSMKAICVPGELNGLSARAVGYGDIISQERRLRQAAILGENILKYANLLRGR